MQSSTESQHHLNITVWNHHLVDDPSLQFLSAPYKARREQLFRTLDNITMQNYLDPAFVSADFSVITGSFSRDASFEKMTAVYFFHPNCQLFIHIKHLLEVLCAAALPLPFSILQSIFEESADIQHFHCLSPFFYLDVESGLIQQRIEGWREWLSSLIRAGEEFWIDVKMGHNRLAALYLKYCANKSISIEHVEQDYLVFNIV